MDSQCQLIIGWKKKIFIKKILPILYEKKTLSRNIYNREVIEKILIQHETKKDSFFNSNSGKIFTLINIELWIRKFFENKKFI